MPKSTNAAKRENPEPRPRDTDAHPLPEPATTRAVCFQNPQFFSSKYHGTMPAAMTEGNEVNVADHEPAAPGLPSTGDLSKKTTLQAQHNGDEAKNGKPEGDEKKTTLQAQHNGDEAKNGKPEGDEKAITPKPTDTVPAVTGSSDSVPAVTTSAGDAKKESNTDTPSDARPIDNTGGTARSATEAVGDTPERQSKKAKVMTEASEPVQPDPKVAEETAPACEPAH